MNIIINGGTRGIGKEVVNNLAINPKNKILITGRNNNSLQALSKQFANVRTAVLDLSEFDSYSESLISIVSGFLGKVDILINVAGLMISKEFLKFSNIEARLMMETNFLGPASFIRLVKPFMESGSHIVNISSMGGFQGSSKYIGLSYYSASKAALACLTECLAAEFASEEIKINCLALGAVQTEMLEEAFPGYRAPLNASEMAEYIAWFALNGHKFFNGKILPVAVSNP
jgi:short-subunit dehydrogenase